MNCFNGHLSGRTFSEECGCGHTAAVHMNDGSEVCCQICDIREYVQEEVKFAMADVFNEAFDTVDSLEQARELVLEKLEKVW